MQPSGYPPVLQTHLAMIYLIFKSTIGIDILVVRATNLHWVLDLWDKNDHSGESQVETSETATSHPAQI